MKKTILFLYILCLSLFLSAAETHAPVTLTTAQDLNSNTINCLYKDCKNFVWIGTANGLNRFDGSNILDFEDFKNKSVIDIVEPDSHILFILSEKNLYKYDRKLRKNTLVKNENNKSFDFKAFALDKNKNLYIIGENKLFFLSQESEVLQTRDIKSFGSALLTDIYIDQNNICWITSSNGLIKYDLGSKKTEIYNNGTDNSLLCFVKENNQLYIGTYKSNVISFDIEKQTFSLLISLNNIHIQTINYSKNQLYVGTNGNGLKIIDIRTKHVKTMMHSPFLSNNELNTNAIYSILIEDSSLWVGTFQGGVSYISNNYQPFKVFESENGFDSSSLNIRSFNIENNTGVGVYGTRSGLVYNDGKKAYYYTTENEEELKSNIILSVHPYGSKYLIGTYSGGLNIFDPHNKTVKQFKKATIFTENSFYSIVQESDSIMWFGTLSGLIRYNVVKDTHTVFDKTNSNITSNDIYYLLKDSSNRIWLATRNGLCFFDKGKIQRVNNKTLASINIIRYLYEDSQKNIWLGCEKQGAIKIAKDLSSIKNYTTQNILPDNYVSSIIEDNNGNIWLTTAKGIVSYKNDLQYSIYSLSDGIPAYTFNDGAIQKIGNTLWWGNEKGLVYLDPSTIKPNNLSNINITQVIIDGFVESAKLNYLSNAPEYLSTITLPSDEKNLSFRFADGRYDYSASDMYEYKLEGLHDDWIKTQIGKEVVIANIPSGKYVLKIRKAGNDATTKSISVIKNTSYASFWILLSATALIIISILLYKYIAHQWVNNEKNLEEGNKVKYQNLKLEESELEEIKQAILKYMEEEKPYLRSDFKLDDLSQAINYSKNKISQVLNQHLSANFSNFVSKYRIEAFKEKAKEGLVEQYTLTALAKECGFSSRSSFFYTVKKLTGQTPAEFLKDTGIESNFLNK